MRTAPGRLQRRGLRACAVRRARSAHARFTLRSSRLRRAACRTPAELLKGPRPGTGGVRLSPPALSRRMETSSGRRCRPGGRLDMSHGFVRHIRRNQLARDAYERAVRQTRGKARGRHTAAPPPAPPPRSARVQSAALR
ncbi:UPF0561 protein C2orf68 homolog [Gallus gallus]|uniref:UPF0561 protein C2orf68 homolog n=1 Tax=Gallus gallus TaxID=9031 RepID=UPI001F032D4F|nr:UPF0561 protein C2orf68 homolog [Gallus gallus]